MEESLRAQTLLSVTGVVEGQRGVWQYKQLLDTHRRDYMKSVADVGRKLSVLEIEENAKKEFFKTYETAKAQSQSLIERLYTIQLQSADKISELLSFMSEVSNPRGASIGEGKLLFSQDADVDKYNGLMGELRDLDRKEVAIIATTKPLQGKPSSLPQVSTAAK